MKGGSIIRSQDKRSVVLLSYLEKDMGKDYINAGVV